MLYASEETKILVCLEKIGLFCLLSQQQRVTESSLCCERAKEESVNPVRGEQVNGRVAAQVFTF